PTNTADMDAAVQLLQERKEAWVAVPVRARIALLDRLIADFGAVAERWVAAGVQAKGLDPRADVAGEEWAIGPYPVLRNMRLLREALGDIARTGRPRIPGPVTTRPDGQVVARVFPATTADKVFFTGVSAEVWMQPGVTTAELPATQATIYHQPHAGRVALVLGAGNVSSIGPMDALYKLFVEDQVIVFKTNPVNAYLGPLMEEAFRAVIEPGYLRVVYGGAAEGAYLCQHPGVEEIHITGSDKTFDAIVFGGGAEGAARKAARTPLLTKRVTGELGNVSPVIVVPGPWQTSDLSYQAAHLVSMLVNNAGFNCNATRVIIQHAAWGQRAPLMGQVRQLLGTLPSRPAYYPGARDRQQAFVAAHPDAEQYGDASGDHLPWTVISGVDPAAQDDIAFTTEAFCGLFAETALDAASVPEFIDRAVAFANDTLWGTLNATILVHPASLKDRATAAAVDRAVAGLRFGSVGVNYWAAASYLLGQTTWGGYPGTDIYDIQSGNDVVHNTLMFARAQKSVVRGPFRAMPVPPFFVTRAHVTGATFRRLSAFEAAPSLGRALGVVGAAIKR
ncbi:MAG TPA: aldehyde dehydrogenase family protein, partial [Ktedonobacterales bacterium]|nr:aldehyde dehydrogenase family protein [Ktedonobacterales bacterium]